MLTNKLKDRSYSEWKTVSRGNSKNNKINNRGNGSNKEISNRFNPLSNNNKDSNENEANREDKRKDCTKYDKIPDPKREQYHMENKNKTISLLENTIADYEEKYKIEMVTVNTM